MKKENLLREFVDILYDRGYKETKYPYTFLDGHLQVVDFEKNGWIVQIECNETEELEKYLKSLDEGTEYDINYNNYEVSSILIQSPVCNIANFIHGNRDGILLVAEPNDYYTHGLELFEYCLELQKVNLLNHELKIMKDRIKLLEWAKESFIPVLEKVGYHALLSSFFCCEFNSDSSDMIVEFDHPSNSSVSIITDCITGEPKINVDGIYITDLIYGKNEEEVFNIMLDNIWKKNEAKFGYIWKNDEKETIDTYNEIQALVDCIVREVKENINLSIIPDRYSDLISKYNKIKENDTK